MNTPKPRVIWEGMSESCCVPIRVDSEGTFWVLEPVEARFCASPRYIWRVETATKSPYYVHAIKGLAQALAANHEELEKAREALRVAMGWFKRLQRKTTDAWAAANADDALACLREMGVEVEGTL